MGQKSHTDNDTRFYTAVVLIEKCENEKEPGLKVKGKTLENRNVEQVL